MKFLTTREVAQQLGLSVRRIRALIALDKLKAQKVGRDYVIEEAALKDVTVHGKRGRPATKKAAAKS